MKQQRIARERVFGPTPEVVTRRLTYILNHLEEEPKPMKKGISILLSPTCRQRGLRRTRRYCKTIFLYRRNGETV